MRTRALRPGARPARPGPRTALEKTRRLLRRRGRRWRRAIRGRSRPRAEVVARCRGETLPGPGRRRGPERPCFSERLRRRSARGAPVAKTPGHEARALKLEACFLTYFVAAGRGVAAVAGRGGLGLRRRAFVAPLFLVVFLCDFFLFFLPASRRRGRRSVDVFSVVAPVTGFVVVLASVFVGGLRLVGEGDPERQEGDGNESGKGLLHFFLQSPVSVAGSGATDESISATLLPRARADVVAGR